MHILILSQKERILHATDPECFGEKDAEINAVHC